MNKKILISGIVLVAFNFNCQQLGLDKKESDSSGIALIAALAGSSSTSTSVSRAVVTTFAGSEILGNSNSAGSTFNFVNAMAFDSEGTLYVADKIVDTVNDRYLIRKINSSGVATAFAGGATGSLVTVGSFTILDGVGTAASFRDTSGITIDAVNNVYVSDSNSHRIRRITSLGSVSTFAGSIGSVQSNGTTESGFSSGRTDAIGTSARFFNPRGIAVDSNGDILVADSNNGRIRKITSNTAIVTTLAGSGSVTEIDGTGTTAGFSLPSGIATDRLGNTYVCGTASIRKITAAGVVTTIGGGLTVTGERTLSFSCSYLASDSSNNLYTFGVNEKIVYKVTSSGVVTKLAGSGESGVSQNGIGTTARFADPRAIAVDLLGNVYISDAGRIVKITQN